MINMNSPVNHEVLMGYSLQPTIGQTQTRGFDTVTVQRFKSTDVHQTQDYVVQEVPVALVYNGVSHAVMMATPKDIDVFAKGFSLSEGIISSLKELYSLEVTYSEQGIQIDMSIATRAFTALKAQRRAMVGRTGCGICGMESLQQFHQDLPKVTNHIQSAWLQQIPHATAQLMLQQDISKVTGGAHAAAWISGGRVVALFEDVGRHNALDKLLGFIAQRQIDVSTGFVVMTSRASYELIRKCAQFNIGLLATISAPTSMAIQMAKSAGLTLASFCRGQGFVVYTDSHQV